MNRWILAVAVPAGIVVVSAVAVQASTTSIQASPTTSAVGQPVTFSATFTSSCSGTIKPHYFTIDGQHYFGNLAVSGQNGTETFSISTLAAGRHTVNYYWQTSTASCIGSASMTYNVDASSTPSPSPSQLPSPTPTPTPTPTRSPTPSPSTVTLVADRPSDTPVLGYLGGALIIAVLGAGVALMRLARR